MPNIATHYLCGLEAVKLLENKKVKELISKNQNIFNLGTQGPDVLFYYEIWPWASKTESSNIGQDMHASKVNLVFKEIIEYILKQNEHIKNILTVYLMGFLCHNCLDSIGHPYVFYWSGFNVQNNKKKDNLYMYYHRRFETNIDVLMCKRLLNKKVYEISPDKLIRVSEEEQNIISNMYDIVIKKVFNINLNRKKISKSIKDMVGVEKILKDPHGTKKKLLSIVDYIIYGIPLYSSIIFPLEITDGLDYLNLKKREWCMPFDRNQKSCHSFIDLFTEAYQKTQRFCEILYSSIFNDNSTIPYALKLFGNNSYTSGIDCNIPVKFKYQDVIFSKAFEKSGINP